MLFSSRPLFGAAFFAFGFALAFDFVAFLAFVFFALPVAFFSAIGSASGWLTAGWDPTISIPQEVWLGGKETCLHGRVVGEPQRASVERQLALLGGPLGRRLQHLEAAAEDVVDRLRGGRRRQPELVPEPFEDPRLLARAAG